jgi:hypothetical protein
MTMQMEGVRRYFDKWYGRERPSTPTSAPTSGSTFAQTRDRRRIEALRGTNAPALLQGLSKLIQEGARRDHEGTITNSHLQSTLAALKGVSTLMEKNERNEALSDLQVKDLIAQLDKLIQFQQDVQRKDPRYSNEARLRESLARKAKEKDGFTRDQLEALMSGKKREDDKNRKGRNPWEDTPFKQSLRHLLYAATGPLGPVFQSLDEVLVSLKDVKTKMASALSKVGSGLNWVGSKIEKGFSAFTGFGMRFLLMMKGFWGRLTGMSGGDGRGGLLGAGARLLAGGAGALLRGGGAILRGGGRLLGRGIGWLGRGAAAVGGSIVGGARRLGVRGGLRGLGVLGGIAGLGYGLHDHGIGHRHVPMPRTPGGNRDAWVAFGGKRRQQLRAHGATQSCGDYDGGGCCRHPSGAFHRVTLTSRANAPPIQLAWLPCRRACLPNDARRAAPPARCGCFRRTLAPFIAAWLIQLSSSGRGCTTSRALM